jgi:hypothetical protein
MNNDRMPVLGYVDIEFDTVCPFTERFFECCDGIFGCQLRRNLATIAG